jgi:hypothetical protein
VALVGRFQRVSEDRVCFLWRPRRFSAHSHGSTNSVSTLPDDHHPAQTKRKVENDLRFVWGQYRISSPCDGSKDFMPPLRKNGNAPKKCMNAY